MNTSAMMDLCQYCKVLQFDDSLCSEYLGRSDIWESIDRTKKRVLSLEYRRDDKLPDLAGLKETGCQFCSFLRRSIRRQVRRDIPTLSTVEQSLKIDSAKYVWVQPKQGPGIPPSSETLELRFLIALEKMGRKLEVKFEIRASEGSLASWLGISQTPPASDRLPAEKVSWIKDCISQCDDSCTHTTLDDPLPLPTRLIYVGDRTGNEFGNPRLVITAGQDAPEYFATNRPEYAILSYCWGPPAEFLKTEKANLSDHLKELRLEDLREKAPTCCDAILVTRELGLKWLWIDALCIIQDDKEDWETESSKMASAYGGAFLTIIPLRSYSTREGFLGERASADYLDICFNSVVNPMIQGTLKVYDSSLGTSTNGTLGEIHDDLGTELRISEWQQRGWTRQESVMSFRRLFFGESGLYFECQEMTKRDNGESVDGCYDTTGDWVNEIEPDMDIVEMLKKHWYQEIEQYSRRSLTVKKDLLPAVTAIAKIFSNTIQGKYLCGLWESDLPNGLLWGITYTNGQVDHEEHMRKISSPEVYIGPSWSWTNPASNSVRVEWLTSYGKTQNPACEIIEAETNIEGTNPFGCIQSAHILIRGLSRFLPGPMLHPIHLPGGTGQAWQIVEHGYFTANCRLDWYVSEYGEARWLNDLMMLLIGVDSGAQTMNGLLLVRAGNENEWYRVGIFFELSGNSEGINPLYNGWEMRTFKLV